MKKMVTTALMMLCIDFGLVKGSFPGRYEALKLYSLNKPWLFHHNTSMTEMDHYERNALRIRVSMQMLYM